MLRLLLLLLAAPLCAQSLSFGAREAKNSYNIVVLSEGWTAGEEQAFHASAQKMAEALFTQVPPYTHFKNFIRITTKFVASQDHGCRRKLARLSQPLPNEVDDNNKNTYFGMIMKTRYYEEGGVRKAVPLPDVSPHPPADINARIAKVVDGMPVDFCFMLSPEDDLSPGVQFDRKQIPVGLVFQSTYDFKTFPDDVAKCMAHELGHAIFGLADEYSDGFCVIPPTEPQEANVTKVADKTKVKWAYLTKNTEPGGKYCASGIWHPTKNCRMLNPREYLQFCVVCLERMTHAMSERVPLIQSVEPGRFPKFGTISSPPTFTVKTRCMEPDPSKSRYVWKWFLDGVDAGPGTRTQGWDGCTYTLQIPGGLSFGSHELRFIIADTLNLSTGEIAAVAPGRTPHTQSWWIWSSNLKSALPKLSKVSSWL